MFYCLIGHSCLPSCPLLKTIVFICCCSHEFCFVLFLLLRFQSAVVGTRFILLARDQTPLVRAMRCDAMQQCIVDAVMVPFVVVIRM